MLGPLICFFHCLKFHFLRMFPFETSTSCLIPSADLCGQQDNLPPGQGLLGGLLNLCDEVEPMTPSLTFQDK